jgi:signal transduction histidine kinase
MAKIEPHSDELTRMYIAALESYLQQGGEAALHRAYEIGRRSLADGRSILDMVSIHHQAMQAMGNASPPSWLRPETLKKAGEFFIECMSPYEMTQRAFGEANEALRRLNESLEEQARLLARELHDESGQLLAAVHIELDDIARNLPADGRTRLQGVKGLLDQVETQLRAISHELRPTVLDDLGLVAALESLAQRVARRKGLRIAVRPFKGARLPARVEVALYRIVQEALNNVSKHARATLVKIQLRVTAKAVVCSIEDNGIGFEPKSLQSNPGGRGLGLLGIQERLQALRGEVRIESVPGQGTKLKITIPLEEG